MLNHYQMPLFGTQVAFMLPAWQVGDHRALVRALFKQLKQFEYEFSSNHTQPKQNAQLYQVNAMAGIVPVAVSAPLFALIQRALAASKPNPRIQDPFFNLAINPLVKLWKIGFSGKKPPSKAEIEAILPLLNPNDIELNPDLRHIFLKKIGMSLDLGAIAKGFITDLMRAELRKQNINNAIINLGGNLMVLGDKDHNGAPWQIGLQKPFSKTQESIGFFTVRDHSVVTSGIYERYFEDQNRLYHHLLNAKIGYPLDNELASVTVIAKHSVDADLYATELYGMGLQNALSFLNQPENRSGDQRLKAIFITRDKKVVLSDPNSMTFKLTDLDYEMI